MTLTTQLQVGTVVALLSANTGTDAAPVYPTDAGARVYAPRDWPTWDNQYPAIFISAPRERKESIGRGQPQFTTSCMVRVASRVSAAGAANDGSAGLVQDALWALQRQVEIAVINATSLMTQIQQILSVETQLAFSASGEKHLGEIVSDFELEFFQDADDFWPPAASDIDELELATQQADLGSDPTGQHAGPGFLLNLQNP